MPATSGIDAGTGIHQAQQLTTTEISTEQSIPISGINQTNNHPDISGSASRERFQHETLQAFQEIYQNIYEDLTASGNTYGLTQDPPENITKIIDALNRVRIKKPEANQKSQGELAEAITKNEQLMLYCQINTYQNGHKKIVLQTNIADAITGVQAKKTNTPEKPLAASDAQQRAAIADRRVQAATTDRSTEQNMGAANRDNAWQQLLDKQLQQVNAAARTIPEQPALTTGEKIKKFFIEIFLPGSTRDATLLKREQAMQNLQQYNTAMDKAITEITNDSKTKNEPPERLKAKIEAFKKESSKHSKAMLQEAKDIFQPVSKAGYIWSKMKESVAVDNFLLWGAVFAFSFAGIGIAIGVISLIAFATRAAIKYFNAAKEYREVMDLQQQYEAVISNISESKAD